MDAATIGVDLAKSVFEVALANAHWRVIARKRLTRSQLERFLAAHPSAHVVMEACGTAHASGGGAPAAAADGGEQQARIEHGTMTNLHALC